MLLCVATGNAIYKTQETPFDFDFSNEIAGLCNAYSCITNEAQCIIQTFVTYFKHFACSVYRKTGMEEPNWM